MIMKFKDFKNILSKAEMKAISGGLKDIGTGEDGCIKKGQKCSYSKPKSCCSKSCTEGKPESGYQCA
jgi:hypothetical protein